MKRCKDCQSFSRHDGIGWCAMRAATPQQWLAETCSDFEERGSMKPEINFASLPVPSRPPRPTFILNGVQPQPGWFAMDFATSVSPFSFWVVQGDERTLISSYAEWLEFCEVAP